MATRNGRKAGLVKFVQSSPGEQMDPPPEPDIANVKFKPMQVSDFFELRRALFAAVGKEVLSRDESDYYLAEALRGRPSSFLMAVAKTEVPYSTKGVLMTKTLVEFLSERYMSDPLQYKGFASMLTMLTNPAVWKKGSELDQEKMQALKAMIADIDGDTEMDAKAAEIPLTDSTRSIGSVHSAQI